MGGLGGLGGLGGFGVLGFGVLGFWGWRRSVDGSLVAIDREEDGDGYPV